MNKILEQRMRELGIRRGYSGVSQRSPACPQKISLNFAGNRWILLASLCFLNFCCGVVSSDAGTSTRAPEDNLEHSQRKISKNRLDDASKDLEQWSQMSKENLQIPADLPAGDSSDGSTTASKPKVSKEDSHMKSKNDETATSPSSNTDEVLVTEQDIRPEDESDSVGQAESVLQSFDVNPADRTNHVPKSTDPLSKDEIVVNEGGPGQDGASSSSIPEVGHSRGSKAVTSDAEESESNASPHQDDGDSGGPKGPSKQGAEESIPQSQPVETTEDRERRKHRAALDENQRRIQSAEESLIKDAVTNGNRALGADTEVSPSESEADADIRETMQQVRRLRIGSKTENPDYDRAFSLCEKLAEKGSAEGLNCLGEFFKHGLGRERDLVRAAQTFQQAAAKGHAPAQRNLAFLYSSGHGVQQSTALAVLNLHFAAVSGDHQAQLAMGYRHMHGVGVPKNCQSAMEFYMPAAEYVVKEMHSNRAQPMIEKQSLSMDGTKSKSVDLDEDVVNYYAYSAERGDSSAQVALGQLHFMGARGLQQDYAEAFRWYLRAAEQGDSNAMGHLGNMYAQGIHVAADNQTALNYFRRGVDKGNALALNGLGFMSMYGMGVPQSYDEAFKSFTKAAEQGNQEARFNLGALHVGGYGVAKDYAKAIYFFTLAANRGHMLALYNLAMMHHNGFGTPRSCPNAVQFIKSVPERGEWATQLQKAYKLYLSGDVDGALLLYLELAEMGFDVAQANAAQILDEERSSFTKGQKARALRLYELSAQQGNMAAELKIGDYYYNGWGTEASYRKAVAHYRAASEARVAQAMFNLGWMHEQGRGVAQDRHLAKRFYDMATEAAPEAAWPAGLCLARLWLLSVGEALVERIDATALALNLRFARQGLKIPSSAVWLPLALAYWDLILGMVILALLVVVVFLRVHLTMARLRRP
jgi:SEL1 protein